MNQSNQERYHQELHDLSEGKLEGIPSCPRCSGTTVRVSYTTQRLFSTSKPDVPSAYTHDDNSIRIICFVCEQPRNDLDYKVTNGELVFVNWHKGSELRNKRETFNVTQAANDIKAQQLLVLTKERTIYHMALVEAVTQLNHLLAEAEDDPLPVQGFIAQAHERWSYKDTLEKNDGTIQPS